MATLNKTYGVTLVVATATYEYAGDANNQFFGGSSDRIAMLKFDAPAELATSEFLSAADLLAKIKADTTADTDNITIGLISGSWAGNTTGGYTAMKSYCNGPTITHYLSTSTTETAKSFGVSELIEAWAANPSAYSGLYLRCSTLSLARVNASDCTIETTVTDRTAPGAPTSATLSLSVAESDPTLSCSGATQGVNNNVFGYEINYSESSNGITWGAWTYLKSVNTTALSFSTTVALPVTRGYFRKYRVKALGEWEIDSAWKETAAVRKNSAPTAPTSVVASPAVYESGNITITWSGSTDVDNNISKYRLRYKTSTDSGATWSVWTFIQDIAGTSFDYVATLNRGDLIAFEVKAIDTFSVESDYVVSNNVFKNSVPQQPVINAPVNGKTIYNAYPRLRTTVRNEPDGQMQTLISAGYMPSTGGELPIGKKVLMRRLNPAAPGSVTATLISEDSQGAQSATTSITFTYAVPSFTDSLLKGETKPKAVHITELRTMVDNVRSYYNLSAYSWAETVTAGTTPLSSWPAHIIELRAAIDEIIALVNGWDTASFANRILLPAWESITETKPSASALQQIRDAIPLL